jgi:hypothetical protein
VFQSISSRTQELQPFPVNHNTSPSYVLIKLSHPFAGARASAAAAGPPPSSSLLRRSSKPSDLSGTSPGSHGSSPCRAWLSPGPSLTAGRGRAAAAPPPPLAGALTGRSTATNRSQVSLIDDPPSMFAWPSPTSPPASRSPLSGPREMNRG